MAGQGLLRRAAIGRGCVNTLRMGNCEGPRPLGKVEKIEPAAIWRVDFSLKRVLAAFSHSPGLLPTFRERPLSLRPTGTGV